MKNKCTDEWGCVDEVWNIKWCDTIVFIIIHAYCKKMIKKSTCYRVTTSNVNVTSSYTN